MSIRLHAMKNRKAALSCAGMSAAIFMLSASVAGPAQSASIVVPWLNQPAVEQSVSAPATPPVAQRACSETDLQIVLGQQGAYHGHATQEIRLTNRGSDACALSGFPDTQLLPTGAAPQTLGAHAQAPQLATERIDLAPGQDAILLIGAPGACDAATGSQRKVTKRLKLALPGGGLKVLDGAHVDTLCGNASVMRFEAVHNEAAANAKAAVMGVSQLGQLTGMVSAPDTVNRGDTLRYTVTLSNPTGAAISFASCPSYTQSLYDDGKVISNTLRLNCGATGAQIAANSSVTYAVQLAIPAELPAGGAKLSWKLQNGPAVGTLILLQ